MDGQGIAGIMVRLYKPYKIAADSDLLVRYLYKTKLKVHYLKRKIISMRMGGLSTDSEKRQQMWDEDVRMYGTHGFLPVPTKVMKMMWKVPQFVEAKFIQMRVERNHVI